MNFPERARHSLATLRKRAPALELDKGHTMKFTVLRLAAAVGFASASLLGAGQASAQGTFLPGHGTTLNCNIGSSGSSVASKSCSEGSVTVEMTAWGFTGNTLDSVTARSGFQQGLISDWNTSGIGVVSGNKESGTGGQHGFDNLTSSCGSTSATTTSAGGVTVSSVNGGCGGSIEGLLLNFGSSQVNLSSLGIGWYSGDADLSVWAWTGGGTGPNMSTQTALSGYASNGGSTTALSGWSLVSSHDMDMASPQSTGGSIYSSYFLVTTYFGAAEANFGAGNDRFKLNQFTVGLCAGTVVNGSCTTGGGGGGSVSAPGTLALAGLGLVGAGFLRRRRG